MCKLLSLTTLTNEQKIEILKAVKDNLDLIFKNNEQLPLLFDLPIIKQYSAGKNHDIPGLIAIINELQPPSYVTQAGLFSREQEQEQEQKQKQEQVALSKN